MTAAGSYFSLLLEINVARTFKKQNTCALIAHAFLTFWNVFMGYYKMHDVCTHCGVSGRANKQIHHLTALEGDSSCPHRGHYRCTLLLVVPSATQWYSELPPFIPLKCGPWPASPHLFFALVVTMPSGSLCEITLCPSNSSVLGQLTRLPLLCLLCFWSFTL